MGRAPPPGRISLLCDYVGGRSLGGMKLLIVGSLALLSASAAFAQTAPPPAGPAAEVLRSYKAQEMNVVKAAEKMPEADFAYKPTPDVRTFGRVVNHVTEAQLHTCSALTGTTFDKTKVPGEDASKDTIVAALKASFEACDKAYGSLTDANVLEMVSVSPTIKRTRLGMAWGNVSHDNEQYATLSLYLRLKGIAPPTSEK